MNLFPFTSLYLIYLKNLFFQAPLGLILTSVKWWENFVDTDRACLKLFKLKKNIQLFRTRLSIITSVWNIAFTVICVLFLQWVSSNRFYLSFDPIYANSTNGTSTVDVEKTVLSLSVAIAQVRYIFSLLY